MKDGLLSMAGLILVGIVAFGAGPAMAQTVAPGPYYANPSWDQTLACTAPASCPRFIVLSNMNSDAVLDRETGLVWERSPDTTAVTWDAAHAQCITKTVGNRRGWRVRTIQDLQSLVDPTQAEPALPAGHPFNVGGPAGPAFWSATTSALNGGARIVAFFNGASGLFDKNFPGIRAWCVRGGQSVDLQG